MKANRKIEPSNPAYDRAQELLQGGDYEGAIEQLKMVPKQSRAEIRCRLVLGVALARLRKNAEAVDVFAKILKDDPNCYDALTWMANLTKDQPKAIGFVKRAISIRPDDSSGWGTLGNCYLAAKQPDEAIKALAKAIELDPDVAEHRHNIGHAYLLLSRHHEAIPQLEKAIKLNPQAPQTYLLLASVYSTYGIAGDALDWLHKALKVHPNNPRIHSAIASCYAMLRNDAKAEEHHKRALALHKDARSAYGTWLINQGRFEDSNAIFNQLISERSDVCFANYSLMQGKKLKPDEAGLSFIDQMEAIRLQKGLSQKDEMYLGYALGKAYEQTKMPELAMASFDTANARAKAVFRSTMDIAPARFENEHQGCRDLTDYLEGANLDQLSSSKPIFIIGMIRSGTTLLDQIISSHPKVNSGGELRYWIEESSRLNLLDKPLPKDSLTRIAQEYITYAQLLAGPNERITDKMPLNYMYAGIIHKAMPNARFVHIRRNPVDTCLSIWTTFFGQGPLFAYDKQNIVANYLEYRKMMEWLRSRIPKDRLHEIDYEELIANPEPTIRGVIEFLDLPWDDACLHHDQNTSAINTPSRWQARQPIYRSSMERWRAYEPWLGEFAQLIDLPPQPLR